MRLLSRSHDARLLVVSSTDGYCTLITFDENELGTVYKKPEIVAPVSSPVKPVSSLVTPVHQAEVAPVSSLVKPVHQAEECLPEVKTATNKETGTVQTASISEPVSRDCSPQRKKARRVVLQTLSTNVGGFTQTPHEPTGGKTEVAKYLVGERVSTNSEECRPVMTAEDAGNNMPCSGQVEDFSKLTNCELANDHEAESMVVCGEMQVAKVRIYLLMQLAAAAAATTTSLYLPVGES